MKHVLAFWWLAAVFALGACFSPEFTTGVIACGPGGSCPPGMTCHGSVCFAGEPPDDAAAGFTVTVTQGGNGSGTVTSSPTGISCGSDCSELYTIGTMVTLTAAPSTGSTFVGWTGGGCSGTGTCTVTVNAATTVTANFMLQDSLMVTLAGNGTGFVQSTPAGINCGTDCMESYPPNTLVSLTALAVTGSQFDGWSGGGCSGLSTCVVTIDAAKMVTATFSLTRHTVTVTKAGNGVGTVASTPTGVDCGDTCSHAFDYNTMVTLTATPATGSTFTGWSGGGCSGTGTCMLTVTAAASVTATFTLTQHALLVTKAGSGAGTVTSSVGSINCGGVCMHAYDYNTTVTLSAAPTTGSTFTGWSGGGCSGTAACVVTMTAAATVTATFTLNTYALTTAKAGNGSGTIGSTPSGIDCGLDCSETYSHGTVITLTPTPTTGSTFAGWSGGGCSGTGTCVVALTAATTVTGTFTLTTHLVQVATSGTGSGSVSGPNITCPADCSETYNYGTMITLIATPSAGSTFNGWTGGGCSGSGNCVINVTQAESVSASFTLNTYLVTVAKTGTGSGTVTSGPAGITCGVDCAEPYGFGTNLTLTATPSPGMVFSGWTGGVGTCAGTTNPCSVTVSQAANVTAQFSITSHNLTITPAGNGTGTVTSNPAGINCGLDCAEPYNYGTTIVLTASANPGSIFTGWSGAGCSGTGTCQFDITSGTTVTPTFILGTNALAVTKTGNGFGTVTSAPAGINCGVDCNENFTNGTGVTLTATPTAGSVFSGWSGGAGNCTGLTNPCSLTIGAPVTVTATFTLTQHVLTIAKNGNGTGTVTSSPGAINCGGTCMHTYDYGTTVTLTASPSANSVFAGWSGGGCSGTGTCVTDVTAAATVTATFNLIQYNLTVAVAGNGTGSVTSMPPGINCGADCNEPYNTGTMVTMTATPALGTNFTGWAAGAGLGTCTGTTSPCQLTMDAAKNLTANFTLTTHLLTVNLMGPGSSGSVASVPAGITCGADCTELYNYNTNVTLTATPATGFNFTGWSGSGCSGTGQCVVSMTTARTVTAQFAIATFALNVNLAGNGALLASVSSAPAGINCGADCTETYNYNTSVTLTPMVMAGSNFTSWSGSCTGSGGCTVSMTAVRNVTATFTLSQYNLTVTKAGDGGTGTVTSSPSGIACGATCVKAYDHGTSVTLTATPDPGTEFAGWSGSGCSGTGACVVGMTQARVVTATFNKIPPNYVFVTSIGTPSNVGGINGMDAFCQARATAAGIAGTYKAYLSTTTVNAIDRISDARGWIRRGDDLPVADTVSDITTDHLFYPINNDEFGNPVPANTYIMTATYPWGAVNTGSQGTCGDWTDANGVGPAAGLAQANSSIFAYFSGVGCSGTNRIYCFGVDRKAVVAPAATPSRKAFMTSNIWSPGGGIAAADAQCASEASAASLPGTYKALLASTSASAISRFNTAAGSLPWARVDGTLITPNASDLTAAGLTRVTASPNRTAANTQSYGNNAMWTGAQSLTAVGTNSQTCNNWTSNAAGNTATGGRAGDTGIPNYWWGYDNGAFGFACNAGNAYLVCLQE